MHEIIDFKVKTRCIVHFQSEEMRGTHMVYYQVCIGPDLQYSPSGEFVFFDATIVDEKNRPESQIHGWKCVDDVIIDEEIEILKQEAA